MKQLSPMEANEINGICKMESDNHQSGDYHIIHDGLSVSMGEQKLGENPSQSITIKKTNFNQLIAWYIRKQSLKK